MATTLEELVIKFEADLSGLRGDLKKVEAAVSNTGKSVDRIGNQISGTLKTVLAGAAAYAVTKFVELVLASEQEALALQKVANATSVSTVALQELRFAAEGVGASADELDGVLVSLNKRLGEARAGSAQAQKQFAALGLDELVRSGADTETVFRALTDQLAQIKDPATADAVAIKILGERASTMTGLLRGGSGALDEWAGKAGRAGIQSSEMTERLASAAQGSIELNRKLKNLAADIDYFLIPVLNKAVDLFAQLIPKADYKFDYQGKMLEGFREFMSKPTPKPLGDVASLFASDRGSKGIDEAARATERYDEAVADLFFDMEQLGRSEQEAAFQQELRTRLSAAGVTADSERGKAIAELTAQYQSLTAAHEAEALMWQVEAAEANRAIAEINEGLRREAEEWINLGEHAQEALADALVDIAFNAKDATQIIASLIEEIGRAIAKMLILKAIEQTVSSIGGGSVGGFAAGGTLNPGNTYTVHRGEQLVTPRVPTRVVPAGQAGGTQITYAPTFSVAPGATKQDVLMAVQAWDARIRRDIVPIVTDARRRGGMRDFH